MIVKYKRYTFISDLHDLFSYAEQISLNLPWLGGNSLDQKNTSEATSNTNSSSNNQQSLECKLWLNSFSLFRGSESTRLLYSVKQLEALTYYGTSFTLNH